MTTDEYVPSNEEMISGDVKVPGVDQWRPITEAEMERGLARVRRDAAREALDGLRESHAQTMSILAAGSRARFYEEKILLRIDRYRDTHYPTPEETP